MSRSSPPPLPAPPPGAPLPELESLFDAAQVILVALDPRGVVTLINRTGAELLDRPKADIVGRDWMDLAIPEANRDLIRSRFSEIFRGSREPEHAYESTIVRRDGTQQVIEWKTSCLRDAGGRITGTVSSGQDISALRLAQQALESSEARFRQLFEAMQEGFALHEMIWDQDGNPVDYRFLEVNPAFETLTGLAKQDLIGHTLREALPDTESFWIERYGTVARTGEPQVFHSYARTLDRHFEVAVFRPAPNQFATLFADVTARVDAHRDLRDNEERLALAEQVGRVGVLDRDLTSENEVWSGTVYEILGLDRETVEPGPDAWMGAIHPQDRAKARRGLKPLLRGEDSPAAEYRVVHPGGEVRWVRAVARVFPARDGRPLGRILATVHDITETRRAQEKVQESADRLRALADRLVRIREDERALLSRELHDEIGQALTGLRMDLSMERANLPQEMSGTKARFARLIENVDGYLDLLRELCSRLRPPILDVMGLGPAIEWQVDEYRDRTEIEFHLSLPEMGPDLPETHATALFRIAQEALTNVMRHADAKNVWITLERHGPAMELAVRDDGRGIDPEKVTARSSLGILGMQERAAALGGELTLEPREGRGTVVKVVFSGT